MNPEKRGGDGILSQGMISMLAYVVNFIAGFFAIIGVIRIMDKEPWGIFSLAMQIVAFTSMLADFGIGPVIMRRLAIAPGRANSIVLEATIARLLLMLPAWLLTLLIGLLLAPGMEFFLILNLMLCNMIVSAKLPVLRGTLESLYRSQSRMSVPVIAMAVDSIVLLALVLLFPFYFRDPLSAMLLYMAANLIGALALTAGSIAYIRRISAEALRIRREGIRELLTAASPLALFLLLNALHITVDTVYLKIFHGAEEVGVFAAAMRIMSPLAVLPFIIAITVVPHIARCSVSDDAAQREKMTNMFSLSIKTLLLGAVILVGLGVTNARTVLNVALNYKFDDAVLPMIILFVLFLPMALNMFLVEVNNARGWTRLNTSLAAVLAGVSIVIGAPLIAAYASTGAAVSKLIATLVGLFFILPRARRDIDMKLLSPVSKAAGILLLFIAVRLLLDDMHLLLSNAAALLAAVAAMGMLKLFSAEELQQWKWRVRELLGRSA
jgi:O-antigen/teichoic acid export membrane protein